MKKTNWYKKLYINRINKTKKMNLKKKTIKSKFFHLN
jgi:hypothetical protein